MIRYISLLLFIISISFADTKTVAISYFDNTSGTEEYNPLSKGLADMLITDLSNVKSLKIVEREKLESLLKEIDLGEGKFIDPNTAQKLGKGLGAGYMLTGSFLIMGETMRIDARLVNVGTGEVTMAEEMTGEKNTFFTLEKGLVNKLVASLNLDLTKSEARKVKKVQTESFEAFNAYSSAIDALDNKKYEESKKLLEQAVEFDEDFEIAWDQLDELVESIEELLTRKNMRLSNEVFSIINDLEKNSKLSCEVFVKMFHLKWYDLIRTIKDFNDSLNVLVPHREGNNHNGVLYKAYRETSKFLVNAKTPLGYPVYEQQKDFIDNMLIYKNLYYRGGDFMNYADTIMKNLGYNLDYEIPLVKIPEAMSWEEYQEINRTRRSIITGFINRELKNSDQHGTDILSIKRGKCLKRILSDNIFNKSFTSLDEYILAVQDQFTEFVDLLKYVDSKELDIGLCENFGSLVGLPPDPFGNSGLGEIENPIKIIGKKLINKGDYFGYLIRGLMNLEYISGKNIVIKGLNGNNKNIKTVIDELAIYFGQKYFNNHPYDVDEERLEILSLAIFRKQNPEIYDFYEWVNKYGTLQSWHIRGKRWDFYNGPEIEIVQYDVNNPIPEVFSLVNNISEISFNTCITQNELNIEKDKFPNKSFTTSIEWLGQNRPALREKDRKRFIQFSEKEESDLSEKEKKELKELRKQVDSNTMSDQCIATFNLLRMKSSNQISNKQYQEKKNKIYRQIKYVMINEFRKSFEQMESNEEKINSLKEHQQWYGKFSDEFFQELKNELGL